LVKSECRSLPKVSEERKKKMHQENHTKRVKEEEEVKNSRKLCDAGLQADDMGLERLWLEAAT
jgi:hypothetical protein